MQFWIQECSPQSLKTHLFKVLCWDQQIISEINDHLWSTRLELVRQIVVLMTEERDQESIVTLDVFRSISQGYPILEWLSEDGMS